MKHELIPTLDRDGSGRRRWPSNAARETFADDLLDSFKFEAALAGHPDVAATEAEALELLARHHALPSPLIDFTRSPFIAAYFAYVNCRPPTRCSVWQIDRAALPEPLPEVKVIEDPMLIRLNDRAIRQRGIFIRVGTGVRSLADLVGDAVVRYDLPASHRTSALAELEEMNINAARLFGDLDAVARTAASRVVLPAASPKGSR